MKVIQWLAAAVLLFSVGGVANAQFLDRGTTEWNLNGNIDFDNEVWNINARWAPFINRNVQYGVDLGLIDGPGIDTSGTIVGLVNYHFRGDATGEVEDRPVIPYVGLALGSGFGDIDGTVWGVHGGAKWFMNPNVALTGELRWRDFSGGDNNTSLNFGVSVFR
ncbi:MAG: hypothetical protein KY468_18105 [Armatimonadetes bacterium]|nr:hypothetical protein [Armatimonadota bacterium]